MTQREKKRRDAYFEQAKQSFKRLVKADGVRSPISATRSFHGDIYFMAMCPHCYEISGYVTDEKKSEVNCLHCKEEFEVDWSGMEDIFNENENEIKK